MRFYDDDIAASRMKEIKDEEEKIEKTKDLEQFIESFNAKIKKGLVILSNENIEIIKNKNSRKISFQEIECVAIKLPVYFLNGQMNISLKTGEEIRLDYSFSNSESVQRLKHAFDRIMKINAFENDTMRSPFLVVSSVTNIFTVVIASCIIFFHFVAGIALMSIPNIGMLIGSIFVISSIVIEIIVLRQVVHSIEGKCPVCEFNLVGNKNLKFQHCKKCNERISIGNDYFDAVGDRNEHINSKSLKK